MRGLITLYEQGGDPLPGVLVEIQGPGADKRIRRATSARDGTFKIPRVPQGNYRFKLTANGFQSVMGTITVSKRAPRDSEIKIGMPVGV